MNLLILAAAVSAPLAQQTAAPLSAPAPAAVAQPAAQVERAPGGCEQAEATAPVQWVGAESKHAPGFELVTDAAAWSRLWAAHLGVDGEHGAYSRHFAPHVDFDRYLVVAYFRGPSTNHDGEVLKSITTTATRPAAPKQINAADFYPPPPRPPLYTVLRFESSTFQSESAGGKGVATTPYGIWLIPIPPASTPTSIGNQFIIQEGSRSLKDEPVRYEEVAVLQPGC